MPEYQPKLGEGYFEVQSIYGARTRLPLVQIRVTDHEGRKARIVVSPQQAREFGADLFEAAEATVGDSFLMDFVVNLVGGSQEDRDKMGVVLMNEFRAHRQTVAEKTKAADEAE